ncbi:MAG TPA: GNAT family protein [Capsulimonadaceae bacterium]|jgi:RimJ/RimL family protein N-acetyltransferase
MTESTPILTGKFVRLEPLNSSHVAGLWHAAQFDSMWAYMPQHPRTPDQLSALVDEFLRPDYLTHNIPLAIVDTSTNQPVGSTQILDIQWAHRGGEIGWTWLTPRVWRSAVNTECKLLLLTYCFENLGFIRVQLKTDARNERSQQAIERLGAIREGVLRKHRILNDGYIRDSVYYSIVDDEWPKVKANLVRKLKNHAP